MNLKKFLAELKRRNVFKVATAYAITGWLIIQIVTSISGPLSLPKWFSPAIIILVLIGFPIALLFAWAFELTPEGIKKTADISVEKSEVKSTGKKLKGLIIGALALLIVFLLVDKFYFSNSFDNAKLPSIAVLPFADMSPKKDQEYFSDGLSEELLNVLAKVQNIKVAGRTSSFKFKGKNDDIKMIGSELGVEHILEGSVRKSGDKIRITAQLIKVSDGFHMWSETYDEDYTADNLFDIQDDISKKILKELKIKLSIKDENIKTNVLTSNTEAYDAYLKGKRLLINRKPKEIEEAIKQFQLAITLDDTFAMAYGQLATSYWHLFNYGNIERETAFNNMRKNIDKAMMLNTNLGYAYAALGHYYKDKDLLVTDENTKNYKEALKKAYEMEPNNPEIIMWYANSLSGVDDKKIEMYLKAEEIDPLAPIIKNNLAITYKFRKEYHKAEEVAKKNIELNPEFVASRILLIEMLTTPPNSKLGEGFIEAFKAYKKYPESLNVLKLLADLSTSLSLFKVSEEIEETITRVYPENTSFMEVKFNNLINAKKFKEAIKFMDDVDKKTGIQIGSSAMLLGQLFKFQFLNQNAEAPYNYIKKYHPIYLSDTTTLSTLKYKNEIEALPQIINIFRKVKVPKETTDRLLKIYISKTEVVYQYGGDITKETVFILNLLSNIAGLKGDGKLFYDIQNEIYFNRKNKTYSKLQFDLDPTFDKIRNAPEVKLIHKKIAEDLATMRAKAVEFLKSEGVWEQYKE